LNNPFSCSLYETKAMQSLTGETIRPGGFELTKRAADLIGISPGKRILDSGCGLGSSMEFLRREYKAYVTGIDPSPSMVEASLKKVDSLNAGFGSSENIPYEDGSFDVLFSECSLSHSKSIRASFGEFRRVLANNGFLALSDLYLREQEETENISANTPVDTGILTSEEIKYIAAEAGFKILVFEDHTRLLVQLVCDIIMNYGSMESFLKAASNEGYACSYEKSDKKNHGYYLLIAEKNR
jgi:arsenite methyltransferase